MQISIYQSIMVCAVVALCEHGQPIAPCDLTQIPVVSREITGNDDPNVSAWGIYGVLADQSIEHMADCPSQELADAIAEAINFRLCMRAAA